MQKFFKLVYWTSLSLILFFIILAVARQFIPLELTNQKFQNVWDDIIFYGFTGAILFTLTGTIKKSDTSASVLNTVLLTFLITGISLIIMFMALFTDMCSWTTDKVLFKNRQDHSVQIVKRNYGCGATDSGKPRTKLFKVHALTKNVSWVTIADTNAINTNKWRRIVSTE